MKKFLKKELKVVVFDDFYVHSKLKELKQYIKRKSLTTQVRSYKLSALNKFMDNINSLDTAYYVLCSELDYTVEINSMPEKVAKFFNIYHKKIKSCVLPVGNITPLISPKLLSNCSIEWINKNILKFKGQIKKEYPYVQPKNEGCISTNLSNLNAILYGGHIFDFIIQMNERNKRDD